MAYQKNTWRLYDNSISIEEQPDAIITKQKLDNIENGIANAIADLSIGKVHKGDVANCEIVNNENVPGSKIINMTIPREVRWIVSDIELQNGTIAPDGVLISDIILDSKGNVFTINNEDGVFILNKRINIRGKDAPNIQWISNW